MNWRESAKQPGFAAQQVAGRGAKVGCIELRVLSSGTWDSPPMLLLTCERVDTFGYLINAGEGLQRFCVEHKMRLVGKLQRVLCTRMTWDTTGGLPGLLLTMADGGHAGVVKLHGPARLPQLVSSFRRFVVQHAMPQLVSETPEDWPDASRQTLEESGICVTPILLNPLAATPAATETHSVAVAAEADDAMEARPGGPEPKRRRLENADGRCAGQPATATAFESGASGTNGTATAASAAAVDAAHSAGHMPPGPAASAAEMPSLCWLLEMPPVPPRFDVKAAEALDVPSGPLRARLCEGKSITLPSGTEIRPEQVLSGGSPGEIILIVDCPATSHVAKLASHPALAELTGRVSSAADGSDVAGAAPAEAGPAEAASSAAPPAAGALTDAAMEGTAAMGGDVGDAARAAEGGGGGGSGGERGGRFLAAASLHMVVHLTPPDVCASTEYVTWCNALPAAATQVFTNFTPQPQRFAFVASARLQLKLHGIHAAVFPKPLSMPTLCGGGLPAGLERGTAADMLCRMILRPTKLAGLCREEEETLVRWQDSTGSYNTLQVRRAA